MREKIYSLSAPFINFDLPLATISIKYLNIFDCAKKTIDCFLIASTSRLQKKL